MRRDAGGSRSPCARISISLAQINATGATWLDRQAIAREPVALGGGGFGAEVRQAMDRRADHLINQGPRRTTDARRQLPRPD